MIRCLSIVYPVFLKPAHIIWGFLVFLNLQTVLSVSAQDFHDFGFHRRINVPVYDIASNKLDLAWSGGLNSCQFARFDLNFNGIEDLIVFDRHGNRLLTFLNDGSEGEYAFSFAPEYIHHFPEMRAWVQFIDYNNNGKKDIFTYTTGGIKVFRNISDSVIRFEQVTFPFLRTQIGNIQTNLFVTDVDYPAIVDADGDGDLDVITFWVLTTFVEKHSNKSMETYGHSDSLIYEKTEYCWGYFAESEESNMITLDTCVNYKISEKLAVPYPEDTYRHAGSTLLLADITGNGLKDLILGDTDFPGLFLLKNDGTPESAYIADVDTLFPSNTRPVHLYSMPSAHYVDITNNGINDLVVSPFESGLRRSKHHESVWFYRNTGSNEMPVFEFEREDLFQHRMIDVGSAAKPVFVDIDHDGLPDLFIGNYGYNDTCFLDQFKVLRCKYTSSLAYYKNTGAPGNPEFTLVTNDFAGLSALGLRGIYPAFGDLFNDGKPEMLIGNEAGNLLLFRDRSNLKGNPDYELIDDNYQQIHAGAFSAPQLIDLNGNGLPDLVVGGEDGKIRYYENQGSAGNPLFVRRSDEMGSVNVTDPMNSYTGHCIPHFFRDTGNRLRLFAGSESGRVLYYRDIDGNLEGSFTLAEERLLNVNEGIYSAPATAFLTGNDYPDLLIGNYSGGLSFYQGVSPGPIGIGSIERKVPAMKIFPIPAAELIRVAIGDSDFSNARLQVFDFTGRVIYAIDHLNQPETVINTVGWSKGIYMVTVEFLYQYGDRVTERRKAVISR
mgnify:CR=1 FL=1